VTGEKCSLGTVNCPSSDGVGGKRAGTPNINEIVRREHLASGSGARGGTGEGEKGVPTPLKTPAEMYERTGTSKRCRKVAAGIALDDSIPERKTLQQFSRRLESRN